MERIPIRSRIEIGPDWSEASAGRAVVVWRGTTRHSNSEYRSQQIYRFTWINPHPEQGIAHLDLISSEGRAAYALLALTVE